MEINFKGKRALVTGAGKGFGRAICKGLHNCGAEVFALSRTQSDLDSLQEDCPGLHAVCVDLADWGATRTAVQAIKDVDLLVNNAGIVSPSSGSVFEQTEEAFDAVMAVNLKAALNVSQVICKDMVDRQKGGAVVNMSGIGTVTTLPNALVLSVSKAGLEQMTRSLAVELGAHGIRVNSVCPHFTPTNLTKAFFSNPAWSEPWRRRTPLGKFPDVQDVVDAVLFLLSDKAGMIHGTRLPVDGGLWTSKV